MTQRNDELEWRGCVREYTLSTDLSLFDWRLQKAQRARGIPLNPEYPTPTQMDFELALLCNRFSIREYY